MLALLPHPWKHQGLLDSPGQPKMVGQPAEGREWGWVGFEVSSKPFCGSGLVFLNLTASFQRDAVLFKF